MLCVKRNNKGEAERGRARVRARGKQSEVSICFVPLAAETRIILSTYQKKITLSKKPTIVPASTGVLANDKLPVGGSGSLAIVPGSFVPAGPIYGSITVAADGGFSFVPSTTLPSGAVTALYQYQLVAVATGALAPTLATVRLLIMNVPTPVSLPSGSYGSATCPSPSANLASCSVTGTNPFTSCVIQTGTRKGQGGVCFGGCCMTDGTCKSSSCVAAGLGQKLKECNGPQCLDPSGDRLQCRVYVNNCASSKDRKCIGVTTCNSTPNNLDACRASIQDATLRSYIGKTCLDSGIQGTVRKMIFRFAVFSCLGERL